MTGDDEILEGFVEECGECLDRFERDHAAMAGDPGDTASAASALRAVHTIAGTSAFLGLRRLMALAGAGERLIDELGSGRRVHDAHAGSALDAMVVAARATLADLARGGDGDAEHAAVIADLEAALTAGPGTAPGDRRTLADPTEVIRARTGR